VCARRIAVHNRVRDGAPELVELRFFSSVSVACLEAGLRYFQVPTVMYYLEHEKYAEGSHYKPMVKGIAYFSLSVIAWQHPTLSPKEHLIEPRKQLSNR